MKTPTLEARLPNLGDWTIQGTHECTIGLRGGSPSAIQNENIHLLYCYVEIKEQS